MITIYLFLAECELSSGFVFLLTQLITDIVRVLFQFVISFEMMLHCYAVMLISASVVMLHTVFLLHFMFVELS